MPLSLNTFKSYKEILEDYIIQIATEGDIENLMATDGKVNHLEIVNGVCKIDTDLPSYVYYVETEGNFKFEITRNPSIENKKITLFVLCKGTNSNNYVQFPINVRGVKNNVINYSNQKNFIHKFDLETHNFGNFWFLDNRGEVFGLPYDTTITAPNEKITIEWDILEQDESAYSDISNIRIYDENLDAVLYPCLSTPSALQYYDGEVPQTDRYMCIDNENHTIKFYLTSLLDRTPPIGSAIQCGTGSANQYYTTLDKFKNVTMMPDMIEAELSMQYSNADVKFSSYQEPMATMLSVMSYNGSDDNVNNCGTCVAGNISSFNSIRCYGPKKITLTLYTNHKISQIHFLNAGSTTNFNGRNGYSPWATDSGSTWCHVSAYAFYSVKNARDTYDNTIITRYASKVKTAIYYDDKLVKEDMYVGTYGVAETHDIYL